MRFIKTMLINLGITGELLRLFWQHKMWWLVPMVAVLAIFALLLVFAAASGVGPFIYTLF